MKRIMVLGPPGSGKTVLSKQLGRILNIEAYHLDKLLWSPGWQEKPVHEMLEIQNNIIRREKWIIDGYYHKIAGPRFDKADTIILLDLPKYLYLFRVLKRVFKSERDDLSNGCSNKVDVKFLKYVWNYKRDRMAEIINYLNKFRDKQIIIFKSTREIKNFLTELSNKEMYRND